MKKTPYITREKAEEIAKKWPTPFYLYDEKGIRENAEATIMTSDSTALPLRS